jgi:hypothetical protein
MIAYLCNNQVKPLEGFVTEKDDRPRLDNFDTRYKALYSKVNFMITYLCNNQVKPLEGFVVVKDDHPRLGLSSSILLIQKGKLHDSLPV